MAKRQTRRSISVRAEYYATLERAADDACMSVSAFVEEAVRLRLDALGVQLMTRSDALVALRKERSSSPPPPDSDEPSGSGFFTF